MTTNNKYSKGKIYRLVNDINEDCYIGSTCNSLSCRLGGHKVQSKKNPDRFVYKSIEELGGFQHIKIILIEDYPCTSKNELEQRERYWIEQLNPKWNKSIPTITLDENYRERHLQQMKLINKVRYHTDLEYKKNKIEQTLIRYHKNKQLKKKSN